MDKKIKEILHDKYIAPLIVGIILILIPIVIGIIISRCSNSKQPIQNGIKEKIDNNLKTVENTHNTTIPSQDIQKKETLSNNPLASETIEVKIKDDGVRKEILESVKGEGFGENMFYETVARDSAYKTAINDLLSKFPKEKEYIVRRYAKPVKDTIEKTSRGTWKSHIILSVNESDIIKN